MPSERPVFLGPRLRRLRRDLGLTQANMASDLDISPSYVALLERNQRPLTADMLLRLARTYRLDLTELARDGADEHGARLQSVLKEPIFADLDIPQLEAQDVAANFPAFAEAFLRLHTAWREEQLALADQQATSGSETPDAGDPIAASRRFIASRRNSFPQLDDAGERIAEAIAERGGLIPYLKARHQLRVRRLPPDVLVDSVRRLDRHREEILLDERLDAASTGFQLALQISYLECRRVISDIIAEGSFPNENAERLTRRALGNYTAAAILMPYSAFAAAVEARRYDIEALCRQFAVSFEQAAHRLTTLQKPGEERVPFFFLRVDQAGNVSKRLDGAGFPFARHGGGCPIWSVHRAFQTPRRIVTQWLELPDGERFFSVARTVTAGGGSFHAPGVERAVALVCAANEAHRLVYADGEDPSDPAPIGVTCQLCHRMQCAARSAPPIGRAILPDDLRRTSTPFGLSDG